MLDPDRDVEPAAGLSDPQQAAWEQHEEFRARNAAVGAENTYVPYRFHTLENFTARMRGRFARAGWHTREL